jgi:nitroreductase
MDAIELLKTRASNGKLGGECPDPETLRLALQAAARAPDHACLRPVRVRFIRGAALERFGELMAEAVRIANPAAPAHELERARRKAQRAPLVIVVGAVVRSHPRVPEIEQVLTAGAAAYAIMLALHARGYGAIWRTGDVAYDAHVKRALGFAEADALVGFIYAGTALRAVTPLPRAEPEELASDWTG